MPESTTTYPGQARRRFFRPGLRSLLLLIFPLAAGFWPGHGTVRAETCLSAACHASIAALNHLHAPVAEEECAACHEQRNDGHPTPSGPDFAPVDRGAELCYQCHDEVGKGTVIHGPVEEGACLDCHRPHGGAERFLLDAGQDQGPLCFGCHDRESFSRQFPHGPVILGTCTQCHFPHAGPRKNLLTDEPQNLCLGCHDDLARGLREAPVVHQPVTEQPCTSCHQPHSSAIANLLKQEGQSLCFTCHDDIERKFKKSRTRHTALYKDKRCANCHGTHYSEYDHLLHNKETEVCLGCHGQDDPSRSAPLRNIRQELANKKYLHGPVADEQCSFCHDPHGADHKRLLKGPYPGTFYAPYKPGIYDFCFECHDADMLVYPDTDEHTGFRNGRDNLHHLHVVDTRKGRSCQACHEPHASNGAKLISQEGAPFGAWRVPIRFQLTENGGSCAPGCHRQMLYDRVVPADNSQEGEE